MSRSKLQAIRWTSAILAIAIWCVAFFAQPRGGWGVLTFFSFLIVGAPAAMITLHLMDLKSKAKVDNG